MKRLYLLLFLVLGAVALEAQNLAVQSFRMDETDLTANTAGTIVMDQNGQKCALIKVETTQTGFSFDAGSLGVVKTVQHVGEIWVYVPEGVKRLTISHQQLGILRDYDLGQTVKRAKTYILKLTTGEVQTIVKQARTSQYVVFQLTPANAVVELNGELLSTLEGTATKMMRFGQYDYRVQAPDYLPEVGKVTVNDPKQKHVVNVRLKPNFARVTLQVDNNAEIWVNGQKRGEGSWTGNLGAGTYEIETRKAGHRPQTTTRDIVATEGPQTIRLNAPTPIYGEADVNSSPAMADIYVDGQKRGQTPMLLEQLLVGQHQLRLSRQGYQDYSGTLTVREGETASVNATMSKQEVAEVAPAASPSSSTAATSGQSRSFTVHGVTFNMIRVEGKDSPYYIGETEVTQALWQAVMGSNPSNFKGHNRPVEMVSWNDCKKFIQKLNAVSVQKFRLPTEAEWEYAAKGGINSRGYEYSGSNTADDVAWYYENSGDLRLNDLIWEWDNVKKYNLRTHDVKTKKPNELGIYDMSGNVYEMCEDFYGSSSSFHAARGGSWQNDAKGCRVTQNYACSPDECTIFLGLRLALQ